MTGQAPQWRTDAGERVFEAACVAVLADTPEEGRGWIVDALGEFADAVEANGGSDHDWLMLAVVLAELATSADPDQFEGGVGVAMEDRTLGTLIDDPDSEVAGDEAGVASLAAMRLLVAHANDDKDTFAAVFEAAGENQSGPPAIMLLAEMAGAAQIDRLNREGKLPGDVQATLAAREAEAAAAAAADAPNVRVAANGWRYTSLPAAAEDQTPQARQLAVPHGDAVYGITPYPTGVPGARDSAIRLGQQQITTGAAPVDGPLCGVEHAEDIEAWQAPHAARTRLNRLLRDARRDTGRPWMLVRVWQHRGPCPGSTGEAAADA